MMEIPAEGLNLFNCSTVCWGIGDPVGNEHSFKHESLNCCSSRRVCTQQGSIIFQPTIEKSLVGLYNPYTSASRMCTLCTIKKSADSFILDLPPGPQDAGSW